MVADSEKTVQNKMKGVTDFTLGEAMKISEIICPEYKMDYAFEKQEDGESATTLEYKD